MNKKQAIAYAQVTLEYMQSSKYTGNINLETFAIEMKQAFKLYPRDIILNIAESKIYAENMSNFILISNKDKNTLE